MAQIYVWIFFFAFLALIEHQPFELITSLFKVF